MTNYPLGRVLETTEAPSVINSAADLVEALGTPESAISLADAIYERYNVSVVHEHDDRLWGPTTAEIEDGRVYLQQGTWEDPDEDVDVIMMSEGEAVAMALAILEGTNYAEQEPEPEAPSFLEALEALSRALKG